MTVFILVANAFKNFLHLFLHFIFGYPRSSCCMQAFSGVGEYKLLSIEVHELLNAVASLVVECEAPRHVDLSSCGTWPQ